jgi:hypothetical protein
MLDRLPNYKELRCSELIAARFLQHSQSQGLEYKKSITEGSGASTDQGKTM